MKITGKVRWNPKGFAFVECTDGRGEDVFIPADGLGGAMDGDIVEVWAHKDPKGPRGDVLSIVQRMRPSISGRYRTMKKWGILEPFDPFPYTIVIPYGRQADARNGDVVVASIDLPQKIKRTKTVTGGIERRLDIPEDIGDDLRLIALRHGIPWRFSKEVEKEADKVSRIDISAELKVRRDLRERTLFTIDGVTAKDFDDAVGIERLGDGTYVITVAIADVAHVVHKGSHLDREALNRSFSVYFPEAAIPMLPEVLSNGVMSLQPHAERLALVAEMHLGPRGRTIGYDCYEAVICSHARLTYDEVNLFLNDRQQTSLITGEIAEGLVMLNTMAGQLYKRRREKGCLDFEIAEIGISLDRAGDVDKIYRMPRGPAERLIEEFMLCANHTVCRFLEDHAMPVLYRIHEKPRPDDLMAFARTLSDIAMDEDVVSELTSAIHTGKDLPRVLQKITGLYHGSHLEGFVNQHILRSLMRARYAHEDLGHFGLGTRGYLHFTSPIRRYPDIIIHRLVKTVLRSGGVSQKDHGRLLRYLKYIGPDVSTREQKTNEAMYEVIKLKTAAYMMRHVGEEFDGVVTSILSFGMFVEIFEPPVDGLVGLSDMGSARITEGRSIKMRKRVISIGDTVRVRLVRVDHIKGYLDFNLVKAQGDVSV